MLTRSGNPTSRGFQSESFDDLSAGRVLGELLRQYILVGGATLTAAVLAALAWFYLLVPTYQSEAYLAVDVRDKANLAHFRATIPLPTFAVVPKSKGRLIAEIHAPAILDPVIAKNYPAGTLQDQARAQLRGMVSIQAAPGEDRKSPSVFVIRVKHSDPNQAHAIATTVVEQFIANSVPGAVERKRLQEHIDQMRERHDNMSQLIERLENEAANLAFPNPDIGQLATPLVELTESRAIYGAEIERLRGVMNGLTADAVLSPPTLPDVAGRPVSLALAITLGLFAGLLAGVALVLLPLVLSFWLNERPQTARNEIDPAN